MKHEKKYFIDVNDRVGFYFGASGYYFGMSGEINDRKRHKRWAKFSEEKEYKVYSMNKYEKSFPKRLMNFLDRTFPQNNRPKFYYDIIF